MRRTEVPADGLRVALVNARERVIPAAMRHVVRALVLVVFMVLGTGCPPRNTGILYANDAFAGPTRAFAIYLDSGHFTAVSVTQTRTSLKLEVMLVQRGAVHAAAPAETVVEFRLGDQIVSLPTAAEAPAVMGANQYAGVFTQWKLGVNLSREQAERFAALPLRAFRTQFGGAPYQLALSEDDSEAMQQHMRTLLTTPL
ncbi:MAG: hypothetical protein JWM10_5359 [Myxococcaceae bacterium]|nr:hypothetical protein [Myxococcaceae bacterium]